MLLRFILRGSTGHCDYKRKALRSDTRIGEIFVKIDLDLVEREILLRERRGKRRHLVVWSVPMDLSSFPGSLAAAQGDRTGGEGKSTGVRKVFVLDTSVLLFDHQVGDIFQIDTSYLDTQSDGLL